MGSCSSGSSQQLQLVLFYIVELSRPVVRSPVQTNFFSIRPRRIARLHDLSTMSNSIDQPCINNVELHRPTVFQQCRTPSTNRISTMSNSIDQPYFNNVELHRPTVCQQCRTPSTNSTSTMSNSIDQQCRTPSAVVLYVKSSNVELYRPSCITVTMVPPSTMSNSDTAN